MTPDAGRQLHVGGGVVRLDAGGCIDEYVACASCAYSLRGLRVDGECPECGHAIGESIQARPFVAGSYWVRTLISGTLLLMIAWVSFPFWLGVAAVAGSRLIIILSAGISPIMALAGTWLLTRRPFGLRPGSHRWLRRTARYSMIALILVQSAHLFFAILISQYDLPHVLSLDLALLYGLAIPSLLLYLRTLAAECAAPALARTSKALAILCAIYFFALGLHATEIIALPWRFEPVFVAGRIVWITIVVWILERYRYRFRCLLCGAKARRFAIA